MATSKDEVVQQILSHKLLEKPLNCPGEIYNLALDCWSLKTKDRPTFKQIVGAISKIKQQYSGKNTEYSQIQSLETTK